MLNEWFRCVECSRPRLLLHHLMWFQALLTNTIYEYSDILFVASYVIFKLNNMYTLWVPPCCDWSWMMTVIVNVNNDLWQIWVCPYLGVNQSFRLWDQAMKRTKGLGIYCRSPTRSQVGRLWINMYCLLYSKLLSTYCMRYACVVTKLMMYSSRLTPTVESLLKLIHVY